MNTKTKHLPASKKVEARVFLRPRDEGARSALWQHFTRTSNGNGPPPSLSRTLDDGQTEEVFQVSPEQAAKALSDLGNVATVFVEIPGRAILKEGCPASVSKHLKGFGDALLVE